MYIIQVSAYVWSFNENLSAVSEYTCSCEILSWITAMRNPMSLCTGMPVYVCVCVCIRRCQCVCLRSVHLLYSSLLHASAYQHVLAYTCACCMGRVSEWLVTPKVFVWILSISVRHYMGACIGGTWASSQRMLASLGVMGAHAITHTLFYTCTLSCR